MDIVYDERFDQFDDDDDVPFKLETMQKMFKDIFEPFFDDNICICVDGKVRHGDFTTNMWDYDIFSITSYSEFVKKVHSNVYSLVVYQREDGLLVFEAVNEQGVVQRCFGIRVTTDEGWSYYRNNHYSMSMLETIFLDDKLSQYPKLNLEYIG